MDRTQPLASAFLERLGGVAGDAKASELEAHLSGLIARAEAAWEGVRVDRVHFAGYMGERLRDTSNGPSTALESSDIVGLYLACACAGGDSAAIATIDEHFLNDFDAVLARMAVREGFVEEVKQQVRTKLFVAEAGGRPRIADYVGRGDLRTFLRILVLRHAISERRKGRREVQLDADEPSTVEFWAAADPELLHLRRTYEAAFKEVFADAVRSLTSEERNLLRYHYLHGLNIDHIGAIFGIHRVTAARRLTKVRQALVARTRLFLAERLRLSASELESILRLLEGEIDISLRRLLENTPRS